MLVLCAYLLLVAMFGGSSRPDAVQLVGLRPLAALFLIPALLMVSRARVAPVRAPVWLLVLLGLWMILQLVPLPPGLWHALPGRAPIAALDAQLGTSEIWRPISLVPARTINALAGLVVPLTGLLLFAVSGVSRRTAIVLLIGFGVANALLSLVQVIGGPDSPLYFYAFTNPGGTVGFFANQNHSAVLSALVLVLIAYAAAEQGFGFTTAVARLLLASAFILVLLVALVGQSRAGLLTTILALGSGALMLWLGRTLPRSRAGETGPAPVLVVGAMAGGVALLAALFFYFDRIPALGRITASGSFEDLRWSLVPVLLTMIRTFWLTGAGFGSFEDVYHIYEPSALMMPSYVNMAHNDWAQWPIEGGLPAILIVAAALAWLARGLLRLAGSGRADAVRLIAWLTVFAIIAFASMADYPLRAPLFQLVAVWLVGTFALEQRRATSHG